MQEAISGASPSASPNPISTLPAPLPPRVPAVLAAGTPSPFGDDLDWSGIEVEGDFSGQRATRADIARCRMLRTSLAFVDLTLARISDSQFVGCDFSGATLDEAALTRVEFVDCRMSGVTAIDSRLRDVRLVRCRVDHATFHQAVGQRVTFEECSLVGVDLSGAVLTKVRMFDSDLTEADFSSIKVTDGRLHGSKLERLRGVRHLGQVTIDSSQVVPMAMELLAGAGVRVDDDRDGGLPGRRLRPSLGG